MVIELKKEEVDKATEELKQALILFVVGDSPTIAFVEKCISWQVNNVSKPKVYYNNDWYCLVKFTNSANKNEVIYSCPPLPNNSTIIVMIWRHDLDFNKEVLQFVPKCVKY